MQNHGLTAGKRLEIRVPFGLPHIRGSIRQRSSLRYALGGWVDPQCTSISHGERRAVWRSYWAEMVGLCNVSTASGLLLRASCSGHLHRTSGSGATGVDAELGPLSAGKVALRDGMMLRFSWV